MNANDSNRQLRAELQRITDTYTGGKAEKQIELIAELSVSYQHSIQLRQRAIIGQPETFKFNCHQYTFYDFVSVVINKDESSPVRSYELCDDIVNQTWVKRSIDLYAYRGRVVNLKVSFESDFINPSDFYVDDFRFE